MVEKKFLVDRIADALEEIAGLLKEIAHNQHTTVATPVISCSSNSVTITCATTGAAIHYTTDGTAPTAESALYSEAITITETTTFKAIGVKAGSTNSAVATKECTYA